MKIAIDIDDTLTTVDRMGCATEYLKKAGLKFNVVNPAAHALFEIYDWKKEDVTRFFEAGGARTFLDAPVKRGAKETLEKWRAAGHEITILTSRIPEWFPEPEALSRMQLDKNKIPYDNLVANEWHKGEYCKEHGMDILIDDNFEFCRKAQELGVKAILFVDQSNLDHAKEIAYAGSSWAHIASAVEYILNPPRERD